MANEVDVYLATLAESDRARIAEIYARAQAVVPDAVQGTTYGMPALLYKSKGLIAVMSNKNHIGIYPFGALAEIADAATEVGLDITKGSIHLGPGQTLPSDLLEKLLYRRVAKLDGA